MQSVEAGVVPPSARPASGARPAIRVRPVPQCDPPFDDELMPELWAATQPALFDWPVRRTAERRPPAPSPATTAPPKRPIDLPEHSGTSADARLAVRRFVSMCVEVLNGYRPAAHLRRVSAPKEAATVVAQGVAGARRIAQLRRAAGRPDDRRTRRPGPVGVIGLRLCEPRPGAVEAAVLLVTGERTWAMALRLEQDQRGWAATVLQLI